MKHFTFSLLALSLSMLTMHAQTVSDVTSSYLTNPSFETDQAATSLTSGTTAPTGWTLTTTATSNCQYGVANSSTTILGIGSTFSPQNGNNYYYIRCNWNTNRPFTLSQEVKLPAGSYRISAYYTTYSNTASAPVYTFSATEGETTQSAAMLANATSWTKVSVVVNKTSDANTALTLAASMTQTSDAKDQHVVLLLDNVTIETVSLASDEQEAALKSAIGTAESKALGFDKGEYAPYNNVKALTVLSAAKALAATTYHASDDVTAATAALNAATWTANETALDAVYDGTFAQKTVYTTSGECQSEMLDEGWTLGTKGAYRLIIDDTSKYPALSQTEAQRALFFWNGSYKYGETTGYTMPLDGSSVYALTFKYAGWDKNQADTYKVSVLNSSNEGLATVDAGKSNKGPQTAGVFKSKIYTFTTGNTASDYVLTVNPAGNSTLADVHIFNTYVRKATTSGYGTICLPYSVTPASNVTVYEIAGVDNVETPTIVYLKTVNSMELGKPYIYYAAENGKPVAAEFKLNATDLATTPVTGENNLTGIFSSQAGTVANDSYILRDGKWYKVDNSSKFNLGNNRAYISSFSGMTVQNDQSGVKAMSIVNPDATAISNIQDSTNEVGSQTIYTLSGQRVSHVSKSGIYIVNGKKIFIK